MSGEIENNDHAKLWGVKEVYYRIRESRVLFILLQNLV